MSEVEPGRQENTASLPPELVAALDDMAPGSTQDTPGARIVHLHLTYGENGKAETMSHLEEQLTLATRTYRLQLAEFLVAGKPLAMLPQYAVVEPAYCKSPPFAESGMLLGLWLEAARKHRPASANLALQHLVDDASSFSGPVYEASLAWAARLYSTKLNDVVTTLRYGGQRAVDNMTYLIQKGSTDPDIAQQFMHTDLFTTFGGNKQKLELHQQIADLAGPRQPDGQLSENYTNLLQLFGQALDEDAPRMTYETVRALNAVAFHTPDLIESLAETHLEVASALRLQAARTIMSLAESALTDEHMHALVQIESTLSNDGDTYTQLLDVYRELQGTVDPAKIQHLTELLPTNLLAAGAAPVPSRAGALIAAYTPGTELSTTFSKRPYLLSLDRKARQIGACRLAREGAVEYALGVADSEPLYGRSTDPIRDLLTVYAESGDQSALSKADQRIETRKAGDARLPELHEFAVRRYAAARRHGHETQAAEALADMEAHHSSTEVYERIYALNLTLQMHLDAGELETAEQYALCLLNDDEIRTSSKTLNPSYRALLVVIHAYAKNDRVSDAVRLAQEHLLGVQPLNHYVLSAVETIAEKSEQPTIPLGANHLDPMHAENL